MKQYLLMKLVKRGFKVWVRADSITGYFCDFEVYVGRTSEGTTIEVGLGERVALQLTETLRGKITSPLLTSLTLSSPTMCLYSRVSTPSASIATSWPLSGWIRSLSPCSSHSPRQM